MKKISLAAVFVLCASLLSGCSRTSIVGSDAAKLLLAEERLDSSLLKESKISFDYQNAKKMAKVGLKNKKIPVQNKKEKGGTGVRSTKEGNKISWTNFNEYSNDISYFDSFINNINKQTSGAASLIDEAKRKVDSSSIWVKTLFYDLLLQVDSTSDTVMRRNGSSYNIVNHHLNELGEDYYDIFYAEIGEKNGVRVSKTGDYRYEYTYIADEVDFKHYFIADKSRGYWVVSSPINERQFSTTVIKDDMCYESLVDFDSGTLMRVDIISSDRKCDILSINTYGILEFYAGAFSNLDSLSINVNEDEIEEFSGTNESNDKIKFLYDSDTKSYFSQSVQDVDLNLSNGRTIKANETFVNGNVIYEGTLFSLSGDGIIPSVRFEVMGNTFEEKMNNLKSFINEVDLSFVREKDTVLKSIETSYNDASSSVFSTSWNNINIDSKENYAKAMEIEDAKLPKFVEKYNKVKDNDTLSRFQQGKLDRGTSFPYITKSSFTANYKNNVVNIIKASTRVSDLKLFEENKNYSLQFALAQYENEEDGYISLIPFETNNEEKVLYKNEEEFVVSASNIDISLSAPKEGTYELVTYIVDEEGIRVTRPTPVKFDEVISNTISNHNFVADVFKTEENILGINSSISDNIVLEIEDKKQVYSYEELYNLLSSEAYKYGIIANDKIEMLSTNDVWLMLNGNEESLLSGTYRLAFTNNVNEIVYVFTTY